MSAFARAMELYPYVFHPTTVLGAGVLLLIYHEWDRQGLDRAALWPRVGSFLGAGVLALVPTVAYFLVTGADPVQSTKGAGWTMDALVAGGLVVAAAGTWVVWRRNDWGPLVPGLMVVVLVATAPYAALSPFWDVSGHVLIALVPTLYLTLVDRTFWPLLAVPVVMVPNRVYLGAHTLPQAVAGFLLGAAVTLGLYWRQAGGSFRPEPDSTRLRH